MSRNCAATSTAWPSSIQPRFGNALTCKEKADMPPRLTHEIITAAIEGFETQKKRIDDQIAELRTLLAGGTSRTSRRAGAAKAEAPEDERRWQEGDCRSTAKEWAASKKAAQHSAPKAAPKGRNGNSRRLAGKRSSRHEEAVGTEKGGSCEGYVGVRLRRRRRSPGNPHSQEQSEKLPSFRSQRRLN